MLVLGITYLTCATPWPAWLLQIDALLARDNHNAQQVQVLRAELARLRGSNRTETLAAMHDVALQEVRCCRVCLNCGLPVQVRHTAPCLP